VSPIEWISLIAMIILAGGVSSRVVMLINKYVPGDRWRWLVSVVFCGASGLATAWLAGDVLGVIGQWGTLNAGQVFAFIGTVYGTANGFYILWFRPRARASAASDAASIEAQA